MQERIQEHGARVYGVEGESSGEWVLVDLGDVVVHIMHPTVREFYNLEEIWGGKPVRMKSEAEAPAKAEEAGEEESRRRVPRLHVVALSGRLPDWAEQACAEYAKRMPRATKSSARSSSAEIWRCRKNCRRGRAG